MGSAGGTLGLQVESFVNSHFVTQISSADVRKIERLKKLHSEYRSTYRWHEYTPKQNQVVRTAPQPVSGSGIEGGQEGVRVPREPKMNVSFPPPAPSSGWNRRQNSLRAREMSDAREPKKSVSMGQIQATGNAPASAGEAKVVRKNQDINGNMDSI